MRDRADKPEYKTKINVALAFSNRVHQLEYYHNSSWLEHGGAPDKAARSAFVSQIDAWLKQNNKYNKNESKITFAAVEDCPDPRDLLLLERHLLRKSDEEGHHKQGHPGGHDGSAAPSA